MSRAPLTAEVVKLELKCRIVGVFPDSATWRQLTKGCCFKSLGGLKITGVNFLCEFGLSCRVCKGFETYRRMNRSKNPAV